MVGIFLQALFRLRRPKWRGKSSWVPTQQVLALSIYFFNEVIDFFSGEQTCISVDPAAPASMFLIPPAPMLGIPPAPMLGGGGRGGGGFLLYSLRPGAGCS